MLRSLQTRIKGDCAIPVGGAPEPAPFMDVGLPFFTLDDGNSLPAGDDDDEPFPDSWPVKSTGEARFDAGSPGKV